jgi:hypothetical protein
MSYLNDYIKPTDYGAVRKDINRILSLIHDITAQEPEDEGLQERICISSNVKLRTSNVTFGSTDRTNTDTLNKETTMFTRSIPAIVSAYDLTHVTTGTLTFPVDNHKLGGGALFDGSSYITISDHADLDTDTGLSFGGWFYLPATDAGDTAFQNILDKGTAYSLTIDPHATAANQLRGTVGIYGTNDVTTEAGTTVTTEDSVSIEANATVDYNVTGTFTPNAWNHVWITWGTPNLKLYINNVLSDTNTSANGTMTTNSTDVTIG